MSDLNSFGDPNATVLYVSSGERGSLEREGIVATEGIYTCLGVSIYDPKIPKAFIAHEYPGQSFSSLMLEIDDNFDDLSRVRVWLGGAGFYGDAERSQIMGRDKIVKELIQRGCGEAAIKTLWLDDSDSDITYAIDVASGEELIKVENPFDEVYDEDEY